MDREAVIKTVVATASVLLFVVALVVIGLVYGEGQEISSTGGLLTVIVIAGFILLITLVGILLDRQ